MNGIVHPRALVLGRNYAASVESCQLAIVQADGDLELAESIVRVYTMARAWPDVERMKRNLSNEARAKRDGAMAALLLPTGGAILK